MMRSVCVAASIALIAAAVPALAQQACSQSGCSDSCPAAATLTASTAAGQACAACERAAEGTQRTATVATESAGPAADCPVSKTFTLKWDLIPFSGRLLTIGTASEGPGRTAAPSHATTVAVSDTGACCQQCAQAPTTAVSTAAGCSCCSGSCASGAPAAQHAAIAVTAPIRRPATPTLPVVAVPPPALPPAMFGGRYALHVVHDQIFMFDAATGTLYTPGNQGAWTVRAALVGGQTGCAQCTLLDAQP